jgi:hypothetical protein
MMTEGPGKYDDMATYVQEKTDAQLVVVAVVGGNKGGGFSVQSVSIELLKQVPQVLRDLADSLEIDLANE